MTLEGDYTALFLNRIPTNNFELNLAHTIYIERRLAGEEDEHCRQQKAKKKSIKLLSNATLVRRGRQIDVCEITESRQCRVASNAKAHFMSILIFHSKAAWTTGLQHYEFTSRTLVPDSPGSSRVVLMHFPNGTGPTVSSVFKCLLLFLLLPLRLTRWLCVWVRNAKWFRKRGKI